MMKNVKGTIHGFHNNLIIMVIDGEKTKRSFAYKSNGNLNHSYVDERIELIFDEQGFVVDCINERHRLIR